MIRTRLLATGALAALVAATSAQAMTHPKLTGTVGPGFTVTLEKGTTKVTKIPAGTYTFVISDKSAIHDFHLIGPVSKLLTTVGFTGSKTVTLTLEKGSYTYQCDPHSLAMHGTFKVT